MYELLIKHPWVVPAALAMLIPIFGIIFGTITQYLQRSRQAELDAALKQEMIQRGMSAEDIVKVLQVRSYPARKGCRPEMPRDDLAQFRK